MAWYEMGGLLGRDRVPFRVVYGCCFSDRGEALQACARESRAPRSGARGPHRRADACGAGREVGPRVWRPAPGWKGKPLCAERSDSASAATR